jgi:hypothetical protein
MRLATILVAYVLTFACAAQVPPQTSRSTKFVLVEGQPEPVPETWVATPEGKFAHAIKPPHPLPKDSGYRSEMTSDQYFDHLCKNEAGEFIYKAADNVQGFYFMRPPTTPTDDELRHRYALEAPDIERVYQLYPADPSGRSTMFVVPGVRLYKFVDEREPDTGVFIRAFGFWNGTVKAKPIEKSSTLRSTYGLTWRGIKRRLDRENAVAGSEWIVIDLRNNEVLALFRNYARTGGTANADEGIWWLNAVQCPNLRPASSAGRAAGRVYQFVEQVLVPKRESIQ